MILLQPIIGIAYRTVDHGGPELEPECAWIGAMAIGGDTARTALAKQTHRAEEGTGSREIARLTEANVKQIAGVVQGAIEVHPLAIDFDQGLIDMPSAAALPRAM